jgi:hypothetical protein
MERIPHLMATNLIFYGGGRTISQTPSPKKDRIYGSKKKTNPNLQKTLRVLNK